MGSEVLEVGSLVQVRGQRWVVSEVSESSLPVDELAVTVLPGRTLVTLTSVSEDDIGEELSVIWEVEPGRAVIPSGALPDVPDPGRWDDPEVLGALVDAVRWGTVASADVSTLQARGSCSPVPPGLATPAPRSGLTARRCPPPSPTSPWSCTSTTTAHGRC